MKKEKYSLQTHEQPQITSLCFLSLCDCSGVWAEKVHFASMTPYSKLLWRKLTHLCSLSREGTMSVEQLQERMAQAGEQFDGNTRQKNMNQDISDTAMRMYSKEKQFSSNVFQMLTLTGFTWSFITILTTKTLMEAVFSMSFYIPFAKDFFCCHDVIDTTKQIMSFA